MSKKESNPGPPEGAKKPPAPPAPPKGPPNRTFHCIGWGMLETKESKRATENYEHYIKGYTEGRVKEESNPTQINYCSTVNCANRIQLEPKCNLKTVEIKEGKCASLIDRKRNDIIPIEPWSRE